MAISSLWPLLGLAAAGSIPDESVWSLPLPANLNSKLWPSILLTIPWRLWDAKNADVFQGEHCSVNLIINQVIDDLLM